MLPSPDLILSAVGYGVLLPAVVVVIALLLAQRIGGEPLAIGIGLVAGLVTLTVANVLNEQFSKGWLHPVESWDWLPALALLGCAAASAEPLTERWPAGRWIGRLVVAALAAWVLVRAQSERDPLGGYWYAALALPVLVLWGLLDWAARRPGAVLPALLALVALAAGALGELAGFLTVAQLGGILGGTLLGWTFVAWRRPTPGVCRAGVPALAVLLPGLLFVTYLNNFSDVPALSYLLLLAAPLALGLAALLPVAEVPAWRRTAFLAGTTLVPLGIALSLAARA